MTHFPACTGCRVDRKTCPTLLGLKRALKGQSVTTVKHKCAAHRPKFEPGDAVAVRTIIDFQIIADRERFGVFPAIFWYRKEKSNQAICYIRPGTCSESGLPFVPKDADSLYAGMVKVNLIHVRAADASRTDVSACKKCQRIPAFLDGKCGAIGPGMKVECPCVPVAPMLGGEVFLVGEEWVTPGATPEFSGLGRWTGGTHWP